MKPRVVFTAARPPVDPRRAPRFALTDVGNTEFFAYHFQDRVRFDHRRGQYLIFRDHRWAPDATGEVRRLILCAIRQRQQAAVAMDKDELREAHLKWAVASQARPRLDAIFALAQSIDGIADAGTDWDADPLLLGVKNGVIDLRTGELRDGVREDRITLQTSVPYDPEARSALWTKTLQAILLERPHIAYVQRCVGYSITGLTREDKWFLSDGGGGNGKGTVLRPIQTALGDYALELPAAVFSQQDREPWELARLPGRRFVLSSETGALHLNPDRLKQLTGGDVVSAAAKYERAFTFTPVAKFWFACNRLPRSADESIGFWRRVVRIPFRVSFVGREDPSIRERLREDERHQRAVLAWAVAGAHRYLRDGLPTPPGDFVAATQAYRDA